MIEHVVIAVALVFLIFLGKRADRQRFRSYIRYRKRRDLLLSKIKKGAVLRGTLSDGETVMISRFGLKKAHPEKESTT